MIPNARVETASVANSETLQASCRRRLWTADRGLLLAAIVLGCAGRAPAAAQAAPRLIFHAPFDGSPDAVIARGQAAPYQARIDGYIDGVQGQAAKSVSKYNGIRWDGRGNIDLDRGTLALFYCPLSEPNVAQRDSLFGVSTDIEGYWAGIVNFVNKKDQGRGAESQFALLFYDHNRYSPDLQFAPIFGRWHEGEWHHLAMVWDRRQGITIYEDGQRVDSNWGEYRWAWNFPPRMLVLGNWQYSTTPFAVDELRIYADCLTDVQVAQLSRVEAVTGEPIPPVALEDARDEELARRGWLPEDLAAVPQVEAGQAMSLTFARITQAVDAKRLVAQPFEGLTGSCWPIQKYGPSTAGRSLAIFFAAGQTFDRVRVFSHGPFAGELRTGGTQSQRLLEVRSARPVWQGRFAEPRSDASLVLVRAAGVSGSADFMRSLGHDPHSIGQLDFYRVDAGVRGDVQRYRGCARLDRMPDTLTGRAVLGDTPVRYDNPVLATAQPIPAWQLSSPAFGGFQLITETLTEAVAMDGVVIELVVDGIAEPTPVRLVVKEPILPQRDWLAGDVVLQPAGPGPQHYTVQLCGRPLITYPADELPVAHNRVLDDPGRELAVLVTAAAPLTWMMGDGGCTIGLCRRRAESIIDAAVADQTEFAREAYAEHNEGHIWDVIGAPGWGRLHYPLKWLMHFAPEARPTMQLASRVGYRDELLPYDEPVNDSGAPAWAFWQRQAFAACQRILFWIIDNRGVETGEFGGVWGDDTDMTEYWTQVALAGDDDGRIAGALRQFWTGLFQHCLKDGVSAAVRDNLHSYEEGMGAISHQLLLDYGDPNAIERVMRASSHYGKWMAANPDGSYRFLGNYLGWDGVWTEGRFGEDQGRNSLMLIPACYLVWYNQHPTLIPCIRDWALALDGPGIVADAALRLRGDADLQRRWYEEQAAKFINDGRYFHRINCLIDEVGVPEDLKGRLLADANNTFRFLDGRLPAYAGYSPVMTEAYWMAYKATGDLAYLVTSYQQACRFINNQDWLYTVAQPSTDRIPLPDTTVVRARLGAFVTERGGHTNTWPRHGISYVSGADSIAALVTENSDAALAVRLYCFAEAQHDLQVRFWRLLPGAYSLSVSRDDDDDGQADALLYERRIEIDRGAYQTLQLPPRSCSILRLQALASRAPDYDLPDPAVGTGDAYRGADGRVVVLVHNVGVRAVENLVVRLTAGGQSIGEQTIASIPPPLDLQPRVVAVVFPSLLAATAGPLTVELDPDRRHPDLNRYNNRLAF